MAFIWLNPNGDGPVVQETAAEVARRLEASDDRFVEFILDPLDDTAAYKPIFIEKEAVWAIESGRGQVTEEIE